MSLPSGPLCPTCTLGGCIPSTAPAPGAGFMQSDGAMTSGVMIVAEALGAEEAKQDKALVGPSGFLMGRAFSRKRWGRGEFNYQNVLRCKPPFNTIRQKNGAYEPWALEAMDHCAPYLDQAIDTLQPKVIVTFGETAFERVTGFPAGELKHAMMSVRGYVFREKQDRCWVVPTFHPAFLLRGQQALTQVFLWDVEKARAIARHGFAYDTPNCLMDPDLETWETYVREFLAQDPLPPLALDVETPYKAANAEDEDDLDVGDITYQIDRISFAFEPTRGVSVVWGMPFLPGIETLVKAAAERGTILIWNRSYDHPRVQAALRLTIPIEHTRDTMDGWHVLYNALPRKLGFATSCLPSSWGLKMWKHLAQSEPAYYSAVDAIALWRNDRDVMQRLTVTGQMPVYDLICRQLDPVLHRMSQKGIGVDLNARAALRATLVEKMAALTGKMNAIVPDHLKNALTWKTDTAAQKGLALRVAHGDISPDAVLYSVPGTKTERTCTVCQQHPVTKTHVSRKTLSPSAATPIPPPSK